MAEKGDIVIKKIKKVSGGHHGGAWKVAYADFVTAMMAFFLLLWLLNATTETQKKGISDYFTPTVGLKDSEGIGFKGGQSPSPDGTKKSELTAVALVSGFPPPGQTKQSKKTLIQADQEAQLFEKAREEIKKAFESDPSLRDLADNVIVEQTPEGLKIEVLDSDKKSMFLSGSKELSEFGKQIMGKLAAVIEMMPNFISITGHTDATPLQLHGRDYTNWELSSDRAQAARRYLIEKGMDKGRVGKVVGMADLDLLLPDDPKSERNRRITIVLLRGSHFTASTYLRARNGSLLSVPKAGDDLLKPVGNSAPKQEGKPAIVEHLAPKTSDE